MIQHCLLKIEETKLTISNCDIDVIDNVLTTSKIKILETLQTSNIDVSNIVIDNLISGPNFHLGSSNFINDIKIITIHNFTSKYLKVSNILLIFQTLRNYAVVTPFALFISWFIVNSNVLFAKY